MAKTPWCSSATLAIASSVAASMRRSQPSGYDTYLEPASAGGAIPRLLTQVRCPSSAVFGEAAGVGEHQGHEVFGGADAEHAVTAPALAVLHDVVATAALAPQQRGHRMPRVRRHL